MNVHTAAATQAQEKTAAAQGKRAPGPVASNSSGIVEGVYTADASRQARLRPSPEEVEEYLEETLALADDLRERGGKDHDARDAEEVPRGLPGDL